MRFLLEEEVQVQARLQMSMTDENLQERVQTHAESSQATAFAHENSEQSSVSTDFSPPRLDSSGDQWLSPQLPVSPVCLPAVCHEKPSRALWHCAPVPWP